MSYQVGREPGIGPARLTCPKTDTDHSDQSVPVLFAPLFLEGRITTARSTSATPTGPCRRHRPSRGAFSGPGMSPGTRASEGSGAPGSAGQGATPLPLGHPAGTPAPAPPSGAPAGYGSVLRRRAMTVAP